MRNVILIAALLPLGACDSGPEVEMKNASVGEVAEEMRKNGDTDPIAQPGKWVSSVTVEELTAPGMSAETSAQMKRMMADAPSVETCLTAEEAKQPKREFFVGKSADGCRFDHFKMGDGKIDSAMRCAQGVTITTVGTYGPDAYTIRTTTKSESEVAPIGTKTMTVRVDAKRVGACDAKTAAQD